MQLGDLVNVYGGGGGRGGGGSNNQHRGRGGRGRGSHRGGHRGSYHNVGYPNQSNSSWTPLPPPPAASIGAFVFGSPAQPVLELPLAPGVMLPPPAPLIVQPGMASQFYQRPKGPPRPPKQKGKYSCETCDKFFETEMLLKGHIDDHVPCEHKTCTFSALPKVVSAHAVIHSRAIPSLNTPEEIARYRAERRKNFPTEENVRRKKEEEEEKRRRGEISEVAPSKRGRRGRGGGGRDSVFPPHKPEQVAPAALALVPGLPAPRLPLPGLAAYPDSDNEAPTETSAKIPPPQPVIPPPLEEGEIKTNTERKKRRCTFFLRGHCKKGDACPFSHEPLPKHRAASLLQKVYEKDIRREYSAALQCLRYIVQNNFLQ